MSFTVHTLGGAQVEGPAGLLAGRAAHRRRIALLALLASSRTGSLTREKIVGYLWPETAPAAARHKLSVALSDLRKELGEHAFVSTGDEIAVDPEVVAADVARFEAALRAGDDARAVELYRGPFLDGFYVDDAPAFEQWMHAERDRLAMEYAGALERLAERAEAAGDADEAARRWRQAAAHDPCGSRVALRLMRALDAAGDRASAIRAFAAHASALREELEMEPEPEVAGLAARLRTAPRAAPPAPPAPPRDHAAVEAAAPPSAADPAQTRAPEPVLREPAPPAPPPSTRGRPRPGLLARLAAVAGGLLAAVLVAFLLVQPGRTPPAPPERIAVLYFRNQGGGRDAGYLAEDLTENLIHQLAQVEGLYVVSPNGVRPYRDRAVPPDSLRRALGVGTLLSASLQPFGDSIRLRVHVVDANSGQELDGTVIRRAMGDRFSLGNDLADEVADFLRVRLGEEVRLREWTVGTREPRARDLVARADEMRTQALNEARRPDSVAVLTAGRSLEIADILLSQAERLDPEWVEPTLRRGWVALDRIELTDMRRKRDWTALAAAHAERALRREPGFPAALELRGTAYWLEADDSAPGRWPQLVGRAEADLRAATAADPSLASAWATLSQVLRFQTDFEEAAFAARQAYHKDAYLRDIDQVLDVLYRSNLALERTEESGRWCAVGRRKFPGDWKFVQCELDILSSPATRKPDPRRALRLLQELREMDPPDKARLAGRPYHPIYRTVRAAVVLARAGREREARDLLARARREAGGDRAVSLFLAYDEAYLRLVLGERERAFELLTHYVRQRPELKPYALRDPQFRTLWSDTAGARLVVRAVK